MGNRAKKWTTLEDLRPGAVFETRNGIRAVKSEYRYSNENPQAQCILLTSGECAHFPEGNSTEVRQIIVR